MPRGCILPAPFATGVSVTRTEKLLAVHHQRRVRERPFGSLLQQNLRRLLHMRASILVTAFGGYHEPAQQVRLLLHLSRTGDDRRCIVVSDAIVRNWEDI